jgi:undecaprenyl diphosphate synthase
VPEAASGEVRVQLKAERGREEILDAARRIAQDVQRGRLLPHAVDAGTIDRYLERQELPELDLLICTGGRRRLSNYLLWQAAYAEMFIAEEVWAEFGREAFVAALVSYQARERRYGRVPAPAAAEPLSLSKAG